MTTGFRLGSVIRSLLTVEGTIEVRRYVPNLSPAANSTCTEAVKSSPRWESGMRVLVTGHRGYLGSVLVNVLRHARFDVVGLDCDLYEGCDFGRVRNRIPDFEIDLRDVEFADLLSFDAVVHLADLPQHPSNPENTPSIDQANVEATVRLAECCRQAKVSRFLYASSCAVYGRGQERWSTEESPVHPTTMHAATRLCCEQELTRRADRTFTPIILRNPIAYGVSPRLRLDLLVNDFVAAAVTTGQIIVQTGGRAWRPLLHVEDIARAYAAVLSTPDEQMGIRPQPVGSQVFNVVNAHENYQFVGIAEAVCEHLPDCVWKACANGQPSAGWRFDDASYQVDGKKLRQAFPNFTFRWDLQLGIRQLRTAMIGAGLTYADWRSDRYRRRARITTLLERGQLSSDMRRTRAVLPLLSEPEVSEQPAAGGLGEVKSAIGA